MPRRLALLALAAALAACGDDGSGSGDGPLDVRSYTIESAAVGRTLDQTLAVPEGDGEGRPLLVFLHGRGGDEDVNLTENFRAALRDLGERAPVVVFPYGGKQSWWHDRKSGDWGRYVVDEVIPRAVEEAGADPGRVAIGGISMGGFGAYDLARLHPDRFCAVGGHSAAIWESAAESMFGAFDGPRDFARHDLLGAARAGDFKPERFWMDRGDEDPFIPGEDALAAALGIKPRTWPGGHFGGYWDSHFDEYLDWYAEQLEQC